MELLKYFTKRSDLHKSQPNYNYVVTNVLMPSFFVKDQVQRQYGDQRENELSFLDQDFLLKLVVVLLQLPVLD